MTCLGMALSLTAACSGSQSEQTSDPAPDMRVAMSAPDMPTTPEADMKDHVDMSGQDPVDMRDAPDGGDMTAQTAPDMRDPVDPGKEANFTLTETERSVTGDGIPTEGVTTRFTSEEIFGEQTHERTFYVHSAEPAATNLPVVIVLHGGTGDAAKMLTARGGGSTAHAQLARGESFAWRPHTDSCQMNDQGKFRGVDRPLRACTPDAIEAHTGPFLLVVPEGILDRGSDSARHWEDGRTPSPGFDQEPEVRDDVGFIAHVIDTVSRQYEGQIDPERVYLIGASNGGMMTQRVVCHAGDPDYPSLSKLAAASAQIATMPVALFEGTDGRTKCGDAHTVSVPLALFLGDGVDTPTCETFLGCSGDETHSGDGRMPFGASGETYNVYSPDSGLVMNAPDVFAMWRAIFVRDTGTTATATDSTIGYFTMAREHTYAGSDVRLLIAVTQGGRHDLGGTRQDYQFQGYPLGWVSRFSRATNGAITYTPGAGLVSGVEARP